MSMERVWVVVSVETFLDLKISFNTDIVPGFCSVIDRSHDDIVNLPLWNKM